MSSIGSVSVKFTADASGLAAGASAASKEMARVQSSSRATSAEFRQAAKVMAEVKTPSEKYADTVARLDNLLKKGLVTQEVYGRAVAKAQKELKAATGSMEGVKEAATATETVVNRISAAFEGVGNAVSSVASAGSAVIQFGEDIAKAAAEIAIVTKAWQVWAGLTSSFRTPEGLFGIAAGLSKALIVIRVAEAGLGALGVEAQGAADFATKATLAFAAFKAGSLLGLGEKLAPLGNVLKTTITSGLTRVGVSAAATSGLFAGLGTVTSAMGGVFTKLLGFSIPGFGQLAATGYLVGKAMFSAHDRAVELAKAITDGTTSVEELAAAVGTIQAVQIDNLAYAMEEMTAAGERSSAAMQGLSDVFVTPFIGAFAAIKSGTASFLQGFSNLIEGITSVLAPIAEALQPIVTLFGVVVEAVLKFVGVLANALGAVLKVAGAMVRVFLAPAITGLTNVVGYIREGLGGAFDWVNSRIEYVSKQVAKFYAFMSKIPIIGGAFASGENVKKKLEQSAAAAAATAAETKRAQEEAAKLGNKWRDEVAKSMQTPLEDYKAKLAEIAKSDLSPADAIKAKDIVLGQLVKALDIKIAVDQTPVEKYNEQLKALNAITATSAEQERILGQARVSATEAFLKSLPDAQAVATPFEQYQAKIEQLNNAIAGLDPRAAGNADTIREIENKKARVRQEYIDKELSSEKSRRAALQAQLAELDAMEQEFAGNDTALAGIREKREKIDKELADIGKAAADAVARDRERVNKLLGRVDTKEYEANIQAITRERQKAEAAFAMAVLQGNQAAVDQASARLDDLARAEEIAKQNQRKAELDGLGVGDIVKPVEDAVSKMRDQFAKLKDAAESGAINADEYAMGVENLFKEGIDIQKQLNRELKTVNKDALKVGDVRTGEGIAEVMRLAVGRDDPAIDQRREQIAKLESIERILRDQGVIPAEILGG